MAKLFPYKKSQWKDMRHICVICLSNARNVTYINGRSSFGGFMDFTVVSSWRYMCPFGAKGMIEMQKQPRLI